MASVLEHLQWIAAALKRGEEPDLGCAALLDAKGNAEKDTRSPWNTALVQDEEDLLAFAREHLSGEEKLVWQYADGALRGGYESARRLLELIGGQSQVYLLRQQSEHAGGDGGDRVFVGRAKRNDVMIRDNTISSIHVQIAPLDDEHAIIVDCRSSNGTFLNGTRLEPNRQENLASGDCVRLGQRMMFFLGRNSLRVFLKLRLADALARHQLR
jgi:hypothetical protein